MANSAAPVRPGWAVGEKVRCSMTDAGSADAAHARPATRRDGAAMWPNHMFEAGQRGASLGSGVSGRSGPQRCGTDTVLQADDDVVAGPARSGDD